MTSQVTLYSPKDWLSGTTGRTSWRTLPNAEEKADELSIDASIVKFADIEAIFATAQRVGIGCDSIGLERLSTTLHLRLISETSKNGAGDLTCARCNHHRASENHKTLVH